MAIPTILVVEADTVLNEWFSAWQWCRVWYPAVLLRWRRRDHGGIRSFGLSSTCFHLLRPPLATVGPWGWELFRYEVVQEFKAALWMEGTVIWFHFLPSSGGIGRSRLKQAPGRWSFQVCFPFVMGFFARKFLYLTLIQ